MINKIFQIGFNRCGTLSLCSFFANNAIDRQFIIHWDYGHLALKMYQNLKENKFLLENSKYENKKFFSDMEGYSREENKWIYLYKEFKLLDEQYPNSKFILNTREENNWIESRKKWYVWFDKKWQTYADIMKSLNNFKCEEEMIENWKREWYEHHIDVLLYFRDRPHDLLVYDIEKNNSDKIIQFFSQDLNFKHKDFPVLNKSGKQFINKNKKPKDYSLYSWC